MADIEYDLETFNDSAKEAIGNSLQGAADITNAALTLLVQRSLDLDINPLITEVMLKKSLEVNIEDLRSKIKFSKRLQKVPAEVIAQTNCDNPFDLFIHFIEKELFKDGPFRKEKFR